MPMAALRHFSTTRHLVIPMPLPFVATPVVLMAFKSLRWSPPLISALADATRRWRLRGGRRMPICAASKRMTRNY